MLSEAIRYLLKSYKDNSNLNKPSSETTVCIHVDEVASKFAKAYEQIRSIVDYYEEHLIRQHSISRALKIDIRLHRRNNVAEVLIKEMIRSGYFPNDQIPETKVAHVQGLINNLTLFIDKSKDNRTYRQDDLASWLISVTASAIEEFLDPPFKDRAMAGAMFLALRENMVISGGKVDDRDRDIQLFIAIQRALLRVDEDQLAYRLLKQFYPYWDDPTDERFEWLASNLLTVKRELDGYARNPLSSYFFKLCNQFNTVFLLLGDIVFDGGKAPEAVEEIFSDEHKLIPAIVSAYNRRFEQQKSRLKNLAFFSVVSLFITKVIIALAIEIPLDNALHTFILANTVASIIFPPLLMTFLLAVIRMPSKHNLDLVQTEIKAAVYNEHRKKYLMMLPESKKRFGRAMVNILFFAVSIFVLWETWRLLQLLKFSVASSIVLILFTSIVAATGVRVNNRAKDISVEPAKASVWSFLGDLIFMPFVTIGKFAIYGLSKIKILVIVFALFDVPFQVLVLFIENLDTFLRSKKEGMY
ncbi:MAG: hypothetical protein M1361_01050 [Patescibacteria group bacterium]|nr:hypothetical protein [Patescibacteria group bacterium]MCL5224191.1 hypothetical protein [Patescibacteria group bacterium]